MNKNGSASLDTQDEVRTVASLAANEPANPRPTTVGPSGNQRGSRRFGGRRRRGHATDGIRYFVGRPGDGDAKPTLEQELASEPEALVIAFKNDSRVYLINEYRVTQKIESGQVRLEKELATAVQRVSTLNAS